MSKLETYRTAIVLFVAAAVLIGISGIPAFKDADSGWKWVAGGIGWFGGLALALTAIATAVYGFVRRRARTA